MTHEPNPAPGRAIILQANALALPLPDESVDLIVTSPPYFAMRKYKDGDLSYDEQIGREPDPFDYLDALWRVTAECHRVLKPTGSLFVNLDDKYNSAASNQNGLGATLQGGQHASNRAERGTTVGLVPVKSQLALPERYVIGVLDGDAGGPWLRRASIIWHKRNAMPDVTNDRVGRRHEVIYHFTKKGKYHANPAVVRSLGSVWDIPTEPLVLPDGAGTHPAAFPLELPQRIIRGWAPDGGVVLDPFGGSGTTALAAFLTGRTGITVDLSASYCTAAAARYREAHTRNFGGTNPTAYTESTGALW